MAAAAKGAQAYHDEEDDPDLAAAIAASLLCMDHDDMGSSDLLLDSLFVVVSVSLFFTKLQHSLTFS